jgi:hypothetical protein
MRQNASVVFPDRFRSGYRDGVAGILKKILMLPKQAWQTGMQVFGGHSDPAIDSMVVVD